MNPLVNSDMPHDLRYALRALRRSPGFALVAVLSLGVGIGANTAIFSVLSAVLLRNLPVSDPGRLVLVNKAGAFNAFSYPLFRELEQRQAVFEGMFGTCEWTVSRAALGARPLDRIAASLVTRNYFAVLGVRAWRGRLFSPSGRAPVAVVSYRFWLRRLHRDPSALGTSLALNGVAATIIGVTPPEFFGDSPGSAPDIFLPADLQPQLMPGSNWLSARNSNWLAVMGRLKPGASERAAEAALNVLYPRLPGAAGRLVLAPGSRGQGALRDRFSQPLWLLMSGAGLLLLIACCNLGSLLLARATARRREIGIRLALGAGRWRLVRQLLTESLLLALAGGLLALWMAAYGGQALLAMASGPANPIRLETGLDWRVFGFTALLALAAAFLFGLLPSLRAVRIDLAPALRAAGRDAAAAPRQTIGRWLVAAQVALSLVLLAGAGLLVRSLANLRGLDPGFQRRNVLLVKLAFPLSRPFFARVSALAGTLGERLAALPGVRSCALSTYAGLNRGHETEVLSLPGQAAELDQVVRVNHVSAGYFETYGIELLRGRAIRGSDVKTSPRIAVINQTLARRFFGNQDPLGRLMSFGKSYDPRRAFEVVGLARDTRYASLREEMFPQVFIPISQGWAPPLYVALRTLGRNTVAAGQVRQAIAQVDPELGVEHTLALEDNLEGTLLQERMLAKLCGFFGMTALLLAAIGIYGTMSYAVARRTHEIGIRMAVGARSSAVRWMVVRGALVLAGLGCAVGLAGALVATRLIRTLLFGLTPYDPATLAGTVVFLLSVALLAAGLPAHRAARVDPLSALRGE